jgi:hypothetical protein
MYGCIGMVITVMQYFKPRVSTILNREKLVSECCSVHLIVTW